MFRSKPQTETIVEEITMTEQPAATKKPASDAECFQPSSFASRKAERESLPMPGGRLASLGASEFEQRNRKTGEIEYLDAEVFVDVDKPTKMYATIDGHPHLIPLHEVQGKTDSVTTVPGAFKLYGRGPSPLTTPAAPDGPVRPV